MSIIRPVASRALDGPAIGKHEVEAAILRLDALARPDADRLAGIGLGALEAHHGGDVERARATPKVEFTRKRAMVRPARLGSPWNTSLIAITGSPRLSKRLRTALLGAPGTQSR